LILERVNTCTSHTTTRMMNRETAESTRLASRFPACSARVVNSIPSDKDTELPVRLMRVSITPRPLLPVNGLRAETRSKVSFVRLLATVSPPYGEIVKSALDHHII
jgi:hypothetical protein